MAKIKIKPNKSFPPSAALSAASPKDVNVLKKNIAQMVLMHNEMKQRRGKNGALGSK